MGYLKGKSTLMLYDRHPELQSKWDKSFWARGYYVSTIGNITEDAIKKYIQEQSEESRKKAILSLDTFPQSHQERNEGRYAGKGYRQLLIDNYMAIFRINEPRKTVYVVTIQYQGLKHNKSYPIFLTG